MISDRYYGAIRLHLLLKLTGGSILFWITVWVLHLAVYDRELLPWNYLWASFFVPAAAIFEFLIRDRSYRSLAGLSRSQIWGITQREVLFVLVALFGVIVMSKDDRLSRVFLAAFFLLYSFWVAWMNLVGHRLLHRHLFQRSIHPANTLVLAPNGEIERDEALTMRDAVPGAEVLGYVSYGGGAVTTIPTFPVLGDFENIREICRSCHAKLLLALGLEARP